jgi:hypothetical protein
MDEPKPTPVPLSETVEMDLRELKALELAARSKIVFHLGRWLVPSQSTGTTYSVSLSPASCTCEDFELRQLPCKHVIAARLVAERDGGESAPPMVVDEVPKRKTYAQNWPAYNAAQQSEKDRFGELLFDLLSGVQEPERTKTGRKPTLLRDRLFAACLKVYIGFSSRRYACDLRPAAGRREGSASSWDTLREPKRSRTGPNVFVRGSKPEHE